MTDILLVLVCVQTVCEGYQQTAKTVYSRPYCTWIRWRLTFCLLVVSDDNLCKAFGLRLGLTKRRHDLDPKLFDNQTMFLKEYFEKFILKKKSADDKKNMQNEGLIQCLLSFSGLFTLVSLPMIDW